MTQDPDPAWMDYQRRMDDQNLDTLVVLHRVWGAIVAASSCCVIGYLAFVLGIFGAAATQSKEAPPAVVGVIFAVIWAFVFVLVAVIASLNFLAAKWIKERRNWVGVVIVSAVNCLNMPLGLGLAVYTLIVINRPTVRPTFQ